MSELLIIATSWRISAMLRLGGAGAAGVPAVRSLPLRSMRSPRSRAITRLSSRCPWMFALTPSRLIPNLAQCRLFARMRERLPLDDTLDVGAGVGLDADLVTS